MIYLARLVDAYATRAPVSSTAESAAVGGDGEDSGMRATADEDGHYCCARGCTRFLAGQRPP